MICFTKPLTPLQKGLTETEICEFKRNLKCYHAAVCNIQNVILPQNDKLIYS